MKRDRGMHLLQSLPESLTDLVISRSFFETTGIDDAFLEVPVENWENNGSFQIAANLVKNLACVNDVAERGVALIQRFNSSISKDEEQKQYLLQVQ